MFTPRCNMSLSEDVTNALVKEWIAKLNNGELTHKDIAEYFGRGMPMQYDSSFSHERLNDAFNILEEFMFYEHHPFVDFLERKSQNYVCENIIKHKTFYYKCRECQVYQDRALCVDCFNNSDHRYHKHKICVAENIKFCNCGEEGVWKNEQHCTTHSTTERNYLLPLDVKFRIHLVFEALLLLIAEFTTLDEESDLEYVTTPDVSYGVFLYDNKSISLKEKLRLLKFIMEGRNDEQMSHDLRSFIKTEKLVFNGLPREIAEELKQKIESFGSAFTVSIVPRHKVILVSFISRIIVWLNDILQRSRHFKEIFTDSMMKPIFSNNRTMLEIFCKGLLENKINENLYKLLISSSLKEYSTKKRLAEFISNNYRNLRTNSRNPSLLTNLTKHLFSVTSLSHHLISTHHSINTILNTFSAQFGTNYKKFTEPEEDHPFNSHSFQESLRALADLGHLLSATPTIWTKELETGFHCGMLAFVGILSMIERMDPFVQKTGEHVEFTRSWQEALAVQKYIGDCVSLFLQWCAVADKKSLKEFYRKTAQLLNERFNRDFKMVTVLNYSTDCLSYDSRTQPVSTYLPLTRILAGLHVCLANSKKLILFEPKRYEFTSIIDPVLRVFVMRAQSNAGLWRRNGNAVEYRNTFYGHLRYRTEMLDRDIQLLQIAACRMYKDEFMIHLLEEFGLTNWIDLNFEETEYAEEIPYIAEQFLELLIHLVSERCIPELSPDRITDKIKQEVIHALCIKPSSSHSELINFLPGHYHLFNLDGIISEVAVLKSNESGKYELRKEFFDRYNPYFYHYLPQQRSESNNFQRQRRKAASEPDCFPPPRLPKLHPYFLPILKILQCDVMFHIMKIVLKRSVNLQSTSYTEAQLQNVLYLIGHALQEEESGHYPSFVFTYKSRMWPLEHYLEKLQSCTREDLPKDLIKWTINKYKEVAGMANVSTSMEIDFQESEKLRKSKLAAGKRAKVLADLAAAQKKFLEYNINEYVEEKIEETEESHTCILCQETQTLQEAGSSVFVIASLVRYSAVLCADKKVSEMKEYQLILDSNRGSANYASSCGHSMHMHCFEKHFLRISAQRSRNVGFDPTYDEFLCPLCQSLNNAILPIMPPFTVSHSVELSVSLFRIIYKFLYRNVIVPRERAIILIWKSLTYTLYTIETLLRHSEKPLLGPSSGRYGLFLQSFVRTCGVLICFQSNRDFHIRCIEELKKILTGKVAAYGSILDFDMLNILIVMTCSKTSLFETTGLHNLHLIFLAQIVKIIIYADFGVPQVENTTMKTDIPPSETDLTFQCILGMLNIQTDLSEDFIWNYIKRASLPFLRCCALFHSALTGTPTPPALTALGGDTFSNLCSFLGLPQTREDLLYNTPAEVLPIIKSWCTSSIAIDLNTRKSPYDTDQYHINQLLELPNDYSQVIDNISSANAFEPHICLVCTETLDDSWILQNGIILRTLEVHQRKCGVGIFLNVNKCKILCAAVFGRLTYAWEAPYVDDYNETDLNLRRGNPLHLSSERYKKFHTLWLSNGFEQEISRKERELM